MEPRRALHGGGGASTFANLLGNLDSGVLRIGGSSQDLMRFDAAAPNTDEVITAEDLAAHPYLQLPRVP